MNKRKASLILAIVFICACVFPYQALADSVWIPLYNPQPTPELAFWGENASVSRVCDVIASSINAQIPTINENVEDKTWVGLMVLAVVGSSTISALAQATDGCYVQYEAFYFQIPGQPIQYLYKLTLLDENMNVLYGPFRYQPNPYVASIPEDEDDLR